MMTTETMSPAEFNDAELVAGSLDGNQDAFRQIVERYQTLISSLAYCATGNVGQSEDLAQQTFVAAWKQLADLRDPASLRPWLCSITRFLISKEFRRQDHEPAHAAESLEAMDEWVSPEPLPPDQAISDEEKAILWRSLERIPEIYREPLVLFYREHQSIGIVARDLALSEDAVKQRLSRGRKLLQEQFLAFVAGALKQTTPGKTFTLGVIATLPLLATTTKAAAVTSAATKGGAMAKATGAGAFLQTLATLSPILLLGGYFGFKMGGDARQSQQQRESVATFWRIVVGSLAAFIVLPFLILVVIKFLPVDFSGDLRQRVMHGMTIWLGLMYAVVPAALILWAWQRRRKFRSQAAGKPEMAANPGRKKRLVLWVAIAMFGTACLLALLLSDTNKNVQNITAAKVRQMVADGRARQAVTFCILQFQTGRSNLWIETQEAGKRVIYSAPVDEATMALVKAQGINCPTYVSGRDFEILGRPGKLLPVFCVFILAIGIVVLLRRPGKFNPQEMDAQQATKSQQVERVGIKVFGTILALAMIEISLLFLLFTLGHQTFSKSVSSTAAQKIIMEHKDAQFEVLQYDDGSKELWITPSGYKSYPGFIAPADDATLALLAENKLSYKTVVQGRDFGHRSPSPWILWPCIILLPIGAILLLRRAWKKNSQSPTPLTSHSSS
jgi:RNA polymerase sigma factor (sigma-70 family)